MDVSALKAHLGDELYAQVKEKLDALDGLSVIATNDGSWLPKSRLTEEIDKRKKLNETVKDLTQQLKDAQGQLDASGVTLLARQLKDAQDQLDAFGDLSGQVTQLTRQLKDRETEIQGLKRSGKIRDALVKANARDVAVVEKLLDPSGITEDDAGNLSGLDEQIQALKGASAYLFSDAQPHNPRGGFNGGKDARQPAAQTANADMNHAIRVAAGRA